MRRPTDSCAPRNGRARRLGASLLATLLLLLAVVAVAIPASGRLTGRWQLLPVLSGSMEPTIQTGSLVLAVRAPLQSVREGDVIVYHIPIGDHHLAAHRVVRVLKGGAHPVVRTKGDANPQTDPWNARLVGPAAWKVRTTVPFLGYAALLVHETWIRMLLVGFPVVLVLLLLLRRLWRAGPHSGAARNVAAGH